MQIISFFLVHLADFALVILGLFGFSLAYYIFHKKHKKQPLVCPLQSKCELVTHSDYSKIFGIPVEILGMLYYASVVVLHVVALAAPSVINFGMVRASLILSAAAFLFSLYLVSIQAFVLKQWCTWCLFSAGTCVFIFFFTYLSLPFGII